MILSQAAPACSFLALNPAVGPYMRHSSAFFPLSKHEVCSVDVVRGLGLHVLPLRDPFQSYYSMCLLFFVRVTRAASQEAAVRLHPVQCDGFGDISCELALAGQAHVDSVQRSRCSVVQPQCHMVHCCMLHSIFNRPDLEAACGGNSFRSSCVCAYTAHLQC